MGMFRMGLAVWGFRGWDGTFLPAGVRPPDMLRQYARRMVCVEGNDVFYGVPSAAVLQRRVAQTPPGFLFCPKIPGSISHDGLLGPKIDPALRFLDHMRSNLGARLGPIFLQLPPQYGPMNGEDLARLLNAWRREGNHPLLVEVRHPDWYRPTPNQRLDTLLSRLGQGRVVLDTRPIYSGSDDPQAENPRKKPQLPLHDVAIGDIAMVRFISHPTASRNEAYLNGWVPRIAEWLRSGKTVYFFVHCPQEEHSPHTARTLQHMLEAQGVSVPPLPWDQLPPQPQQSSLFS